LDTDKVCVLGLWHLGSVSAACLADLGYQVVGVDRDAARVQALNAGRPPLYEPGLEELLARGLTSGRLRFSADMEQGVAGARYVLMAYDTPVNEHDEIDLSEIFTVVEETAPFLENGTTLIVSSQVPVGTCERLAATVRRARSSLDFGIACVPENLRLGQAIARFMRPEFLVFGANDDVTHEHVEQLLAAIDAPKLRVDLPTAEMTKHALNAYLATAISFGNEIANLCDEVGADALKVTQALCLDSRVSPRAPLNPGLGFAGGTLARDMKALCALASENGYEASLLHAVLSVNERQNRMIAARLVQLLPARPGLTVGLLGLTYKAGTSTLRRSPGLELAATLAAEGIRVKAYDPKVEPADLQPYLDILSFCHDPYLVADASDAVVLVTDWPEFRQLDFARMRTLMRSPVLLDPQNVLDADSLAEMGFIYQAVGRGRRPQAQVASA